MKRRRRKHQLSSLMIWLFTFNYKISSKINNCVLHFIQNRKRTASKCWTVILILGCKLENRYGWSLKKIRNDTQYLQNMYLTCVPAGPPRELLGPRAKESWPPPPILQIMILKLSSPRRVIGNELMNCDLQNSFVYLSGPLIIMIWYIY